MPPGGQVKPPNVSVAQILGGDVAVGSTVTVKGWVRTRRDSKAGGGLSFLTVSDGSCFDAVQAVAHPSLANYDGEILHVTTGCAVVVTGELVESQGKGQTVEIQASAVEVVGWVDDPDSYPVAAKRHSFEYLREVAHLRPRTNTFRAETSNTARHLAEFWMVEPEIAFADLAADADLAEECLKFIFTAVLDERADDMAFFNQRIDEGCIARIEALVDSTFERMEYADAVAALEKAAGS